VQHYDAYSVETNRMSFNGNITTFDMWDTYLPQVWMASSRQKKEAVISSQSHLQTHSPMTHDLPNPLSSVQYEIAFVQGEARAVMCSYASINGVPSCANDFILNQVMRGKWGRNETLVATDW
jgi:hypothetical protein